MLREANAGDCSEAAASKYDLLWPLEHGHQVDKTSGSPSDLPNQRTRSVDCITRPLYWGAGGQRLLESCVPERRRKRVGATLTPHELHNGVEFAVLQHHGPSARINCNHKQQEHLDMLQSKEVLSRVKAFLTTRTARTPSTPRGVSRRVSGHCKGDWRTNVLSHRTGNGTVLSYPDKLVSANVR